MFGFLIGGTLSLANGPAEFLPNEFWLMVTGWMCSTFMIAF